MINQEKLKLFSKLEKLGSLKYVSTVFINNGDVDV